MTDDDLLRRSEDEEEVYSECSSHTMVGKKLTDSDKEFDLDLPTRYKVISQSTPAKDVVVEKNIYDRKSEKKLPVDDGKSGKKLPVEEGKSEKKVPALAKKKVQKTLRPENQQPNWKSRLHQSSKRYSSQSS